VADAAAVTAMATRVGSEFGRLDALVNNAGTTIKTPPADADGLEMADWDLVFAVNVRGLFHVGWACVPLLAAAPHPAIVNLASIAGLRPDLSLSPTPPPRLPWPT
jgi:3-oxoacyl-[acyl-carrier protein] reductase